MTSRNILLSVLAAALLSAPAVAQTQHKGAVFSMTNAAAGNEIVVFERSAHGALTLQTPNVATNGLGTGQALESQGSLALSKNGKWLVAVNAGSNDISIFEVSGLTLTLKDTIASGGTKPVSVAVNSDVLYVLNAGAPNNISGFEISPQGQLTAIPNSTWPLSAAQTAPSQVAWTPGNELLLVTERDTEMLDTFEISSTTNSPVTFEAHPAAGRDPLGVAFRGKHKMFVAESWAGAADKGAVSGYGLRKDEVFELNPSVATTETGTGWIATMGNKPWLYVSNPGSDTITGFRVASTAKMQILNHDGVAATTGNQPTDLATVRGERLLYALNFGDGTISGWTVAADGSLTSTGAATAGLPANKAAGLVAR